MTPEDKQMLLDAARAMGHPDPRISEGEWLETRYGLTCAVHFSEPGRRAEGGYWNPLEDDGDCARMCAKLSLSVKHGVCATCVIVSEIKVDGAQFLALYADHNNDRLTAWRYACTRVAAEIWRAKA